MEEKLYGRILQGVGGLYTVRLISVPENMNLSVCQDVVCRARGSFRHNNVSPLPGDTVIISPTTEQIAEKQKNTEGADFVIDEICDRKNSLIRPPMANLDLLFITMAAAAPDPVLSTVDKLICIAEFNKIEPIIVITKKELAPEYADKLEATYKKSGFTVFKLSAIEDTDVSPIDDFISENIKNGKTAAFAGASGIGKSTLLNRLFPELSLSTNEISRKIQRGRHTTRKVELYPLSSSPDCGYIADTPGFSMLDFARFDFFEAADLPLTMREFEKYIGQCKYTKCSHTKEEGCAIVEAVKRGDIPLSRHESFRELYDVLKAKKKW